MKLRKLILDAARVLADEAERNPEFASRLQAILAPAVPTGQVAGGTPSPRSRSSEPSKPRGKNRRAPAMLDPIQVVSEGEAVLRERLSPLTLDQLRDVVADFSMDPGKIVAKWKDRERVIDRVVDISVARSHKGDAFRAQPD